MKMLQCPGYMKLFKVNTNLKLALLQYECLIMAKLAVIVNPNKGPTNTNAMFMELGY